MYFKLVGLQRSAELDLFRVSPAGWCLLYGEEETKHGKRQKSESSSSEILQFSEFAVFIRSFRLKPGQNFP